MESLEDRRLLAANLVPVVRSFGLSTETFTAASPDVLDGVITPGTHRLMRFDFLSWNIGNQALSIGSPAARPELFVYSQAHGHYHLKDFNEYQLLDSVGNLVKPGFKQAFCAIDIEHRSPFGPPNSVFNNCSTNQGISSGWADVYNRSLPGQYIIMDGVADGVYQLRAFTNVSRKIAEDNFDDNVTMVTLRIQGNTVTQLAPTDIGNTISTAWTTGVGAALDGIDISGQIGAPPWNVASPDVDMYRFDALGGTTVNVSTFQPLGGRAMDTYVRVFRADGTQIGSNDDCGASLYSCINNLAIPTTGTYYVGVSGYPNSSYNPTTGAGAVNAPPERLGEYTLRIHQNNPADVGETMATALNTGMGPGAGSRYERPREFVGWSNHGRWDVDMYRFTANAGTTLSARTTGPTTDGADTILRLFDSNGNQLIANDDGPNYGLFSLINYSFTSSGTYYIGVSAYANFSYSPRYPGTGDAAGVSPTMRLGEYRLDLTLTARTDVGDTLAAALNTGMGPAPGNFTLAWEVMGNGPNGRNDADVYRFQATAGARLTASTALPTGGLGMDTILRIRNSGGTIIQENDDCPTGGLYSCINNFTLATAGTYYAEVIGYPVTGNPRSVGDYRLNLALASAPTTALRVTAATATPTAGVGFSVTVAAVDASGNVTPDYRGTVSFTSTDGAATLPGNYTFTAADAGVHTFTGVILRTAGARTITSRDTANGTILGTSNVTVRPAAASVLALTGLPASVTAGAASSVTVTLRDSFNNVATGYTGTVSFTSSDGAATLPANYTFTPADAGTRTFSGVVLRTAGGRTVTARDTVNAALTSTANTTVNAAEADHYQVTASAANVTAGSPFNLTVRVQDVFNNTVSAYNSTVSFYSSDPSGGTMPVDYTFTAADAGVHTFAGETALYVAGPQSIYAYDIFTGIGGSTDVIVDPDVAAFFYVEAPANVLSGLPFDINVYALDAYGNIAPSFNGIVTFSSSDTDPGVVLPANYQFDPATDFGVHTFSGLVLVTPGAQSVDAFDIVYGIGGSAAIQVDPGSAPGGGGAGGRTRPLADVAPATGPATEVRPALNGTGQERGRSPGQLDGATVEWLFTSRTHTEAKGLFTVLPLEV